MNDKPTLLVMAAGLGSRYGGLKQMDPIGPGGEIIIDYSLYDAIKAGFSRAVFVINKKNEADFREKMDRGAARFMQIDYAFQELTDIPEGCTVPEGREKPWGTGHAVLAARHLINGPFAVINADDYYGPSAFKTIYDFLSSAIDDEYYRYCMVSYLIENTLSESGTVSRGICTADSNGNLKTITERTQIKKGTDKILYTEDKGESWEEIHAGTPVSMNLFGFTASLMSEAERIFRREFPAITEAKPLKGEFYLPAVVSELIEAGKANVRLLLSEDKWHGVTYREDRPAVVKAMADMTAAGLYPEKLWK